MVGLPFTCPGVREFQVYDRVISRMGLKRLIFWVVWILEIYVHA